MTHIRYAIIVLFCSMAIHAFSQSPDEKLQQLNLKLPELKKSLGTYVDVVRTGRYLYLSGKGPLQDNGEYITGKLGQDLTVHQGYQAARLTALNQLAVLKKELGQLNKIKRIIKVNGFVNSDSHFYDQPKVINGFSDLLIEVFGDSGRHARTALGTNTLPLNMAVEIEMIVEIK